MINSRKKFWKKFDIVLLITAMLLSLYGLTAISSATANTAVGYMPFLKQQSTALVLGLIAIICLVLFNYETFGNFYLSIYILCNLLLVAVLLFGHGEDQWGAKSWLAIAGFSFQPSEVAKIGIVISVAKVIDKNKESINSLFTLAKILIFAFIPVGLILMQPDFGTALVFMFFIGVMLFVAGLDFKYIFYALVAGVISLPLFWFTLQDYQKERILVFLNPARDALGRGYQVIQSKIAIGSGQLFGRGLFQGVQTQYGYLPEKHTDFIFAVIGEELGLIGGLALMLLYLIMLVRIINISRNAKDLFGSLVVIGVAAMLVFHILENVGMTMGLMPVTGIPLPFISYGGTSLLSNLISIGLVLSVGIRKDKLSF